MNKNNKFYIALLIIFIIALLIFAIANKFLNKKTETFSDIDNSPVSTSTSLQPTNIKYILIEDIQLSTSTKEKPYRFLEVVDSCGIHFVGECVNMRSGPGTEYPSVLQLRTGVVLSINKTVTDKNGKEWYKVQFVHSLLFPERVKGDLYVSADVVKTFYNEGDKDLKDIVKPITKRIVVDLSEQMLYAYDGDELFMKEPVSTGLKSTPTDVGKFTIFKKTPSRYMQGPIEGASDQYYDLPGVPWNLYFTYDGNVIHGAYWHNSFGKKWSHGCVNLPPVKAKELYEWAVVGIPVTVQE